VRIGLISDTHGLLRPEALACLRGSDHIVHAGDIGGPEILEALRALAPLTVVRGNNDRAPWAAALPESADVVLGGVHIHAVHDIAEFVRPTTTPRVVVAGHSHRPSIQDRDGVLYVNPGSAGPRRFKLPVSAGELVIDAGTVVARTHELIR
jgi:uncharacterized protein